MTGSAVVNTCHKYQSGTYALLDEPFTMSILAVVSALDSAGLGPRPHRVYMTTGNVEN
ncbi:MAG: hypothetical protein QGM46_11555 [Actinomycetota bacterium]|nr:hypothetical protein [Actinomycetota bacterium]